MRSRRKSLLSGHSSGVDVRLVLDTNIIVSGLLWRGLPRRIMDQAFEGRGLLLFTTRNLLSELSDVLSRSKFHAALTAIGKPRDEVLLDYATLALLVRPARIPATILQDRTDDAVLACAAAAQADAIVSGDRHLRQLKEFRGIPILTAAELLKQVES